MKKLFKDIELIYKNTNVITSEPDKIIINTGKESVVSILRFLKDKGFDYLTLISCVDWIKDKEFEMVYIISSYSKKNTKKTARIFLKVRIPRRKPEIGTTISVFDNAEPYEREIHELFGINFVGHPRLKPLFLEREYKVPPFRKDFDTRKYVKKVFDNIPEVKG